MLMGAASVATMVESSAPRKTPICNLGFSELQLSESSDVLTHIDPIIIARRLVDISPGRTTCSVPLPSSEGFVAPRRGALSSASWEAVPFVELVSFAI